MSVDGRAQIINFFSEISSTLKAPNVNSFSQTHVPLNGRRRTCCTNRSNCQSLVRQVHHQSVTFHRIGSPRTATALTFQLIVFEHAGQIGAVYRTHSKDPAGCDLAARCSGGLPDGPEDRVEDGPAGYNASGEAGLHHHLCVTHQWRFVSGEHLCLEPLDSGSGASARGVDASSCVKMALAAAPLVAKVFRPGAYESPHCTGGIWRDRHFVGLHKVSSQIRLLSVSKGA